MNFQYLVTPEMIYGEGYEIPKGWEAVDFRTPKANDIYLARQSHRVQENVPTLHWVEPDPRLILREKLPVRIILEECSWEEAQELGNGWKLHRTIHGAICNGDKRCNEVAYWLRIVEGK